MRVVILCSANVHISVTSNVLKPQKEMRAFESRMVTGDLKDHNKSDSWLGDSRRNLSAGLRYIQNKRIILAI